MITILDKTTTPPGGWHYTEPDTGVKFSGLSYVALVAEIRRHRIAMSLPVGSEWLPVFEHTLALQNPGAKQQEEGAKQRQLSADDIVKFVTVVKELLSGEELVSVEEQTRRANICASCPKKGVVACKYCGWLTRELTHMLGGRRVPRATEIFKHSCMACGCDLTAKTACPLPVLKRVDEKIGSTPEYAPGCWMLE
jgi:hypothetical protein